MKRTAQRQLFQELQASGPYPKLLSPASSKNLALIGFGKQNCNSSGFLVCSCTVCASLTLTPDGLAEK